ncbi:NAD dependent epimerase/dehydratase [Biscogniauxia sp. FL1348]|nr:NAD dependent epimerase/dehydratase [Biscogniauxia sp. FL1348]
MILDTICNLYKLRGVRGYSGDTTKEIVISRSRSRRGLCKEASPLHQPTYHLHNRNKPQSQIEHFRSSLRIGKEKMAQPLQESSPKGTVLVTGANGYIAGQVILALLSSGYAVRGTVRSLSRSKRLLDSDSPFHAHAASGRFELVEVPDITAAGAFDAALSGGDLTSIAHLAQPVLLDSTDAQRLSNVAVQGTLNILSAAAKLSSQGQQQQQLKSFVFMSSISAVTGIPPKADRDVITADQWSDLDVKAAAVQARGLRVPGPLAYAASKTAAERALWKFRAERAPPFAVAAVNPVFVAGPPALRVVGPEDVQISGGFVYHILSGGDLPAPEALLGHGAHVDVRDVARLTAFVVDHPHETDGKRLLAVSSYVGPLAVAKVLQEAYPERRELIKGPVLGEDVSDDFAFPDGIPKYDTQTVVDLTGLDWIPFKKTILDAAEAYKVLL